MQGVIMETGNGRAVILTKSGRFVNIKDTNYSVGDNVNIIPDTGRLRAAAASFVLVCAGIGSYFMPAGYVSVDINPSLIMTVNVYNRVIGVKSLNDDADVLLNKIDIKGKSAEDSVEMLIKASEDVGYINDNNRSVILNVVPRITKPDIENVKYNNIDITKENADMETFRIAGAIGVSVAKAKILEEYTEKNGGDLFSNAIRLSDKSVKEIQKLMLDNGDSADNVHLSDSGSLSDKRADHIPSPDPEPQERKSEKVQAQPKSQENKNYKTSDTINSNTFSIGEPKRVWNTIPAEQQPQSEETAYEDMPVYADGGLREISPEINELSDRNIDSENNQPPQPEQEPQGDGISQSEPRQTGDTAQEKPSDDGEAIQAEREQSDDGKPEQAEREQSDDGEAIQTEREQSDDGEAIQAEREQPVDGEPAQTEAKPQDNTSAQGESSPQWGDSEPEEEERRDDKPSENGQQTTGEETHDSIQNQAGESAPDDPEQSDGYNSNAAAPSDKQPQAEQKQDAAEQDKNNLTNTAPETAEPKREPDTEQGSQPTQSDNKAYNKQPDEPRQENNIPQAEPKQPEDAPAGNNSAPPDNARQPV